MFLLNYWDAYRERSLPIHLVCLSSSFCEHLWSLDRAGTHTYSFSSFLAVWMKAVSAPWLTLLPCIGGNFHLLLPSVIPSSCKTGPTGMHQIPISGDLVHGVVHKLCPVVADGDTRQPYLFPSFFPPFSSAPHLCSTRAPGGHAMAPAWLEFGLLLKRKLILIITITTTTITIKEKK